MTATIKPPDRSGRPRKRVPRFSSLESLGFSDSTHTWSDGPPPLDPIVFRQIALSEPETIADWAPTEEMDRLGGTNFRWSILVVVLAVGVAAGLFGWWLYQRPVQEAAAATAAVIAEAETLEIALPALEAFNAQLPTADETADTSGLRDIETAARSLFTLSGELGSSQTDIRSGAASAASSALDGVRLASDAHAYRMAIVPLLVAPDLETDPNLIELDEAARGFGEWQLFFDEVKDALPDNVLPDVTVQIEVLSADLSTMLTRYVDALRADNQSAAEAVLADLADRLGRIGETLGTELGEVQARVSARIDEVDTSLAQLTTVTP